MIPASKPPTLNHDHRCEIFGISIWKIRISDYSHVYSQYQLKPFYHVYITMPAIILENLRSAYNVGNIVRTADALWRDIIITWYTPSPISNPKVIKTSLGAELSVTIAEYPWRHHDGTDITAIQSAIQHARTTYGPVYALEITDSSRDIGSVDRKTLDGQFALLVGNEPEWVEASTLASVDWVIHIPMLWVKESLNVGQCAAIAMWHTMQ